MKKLILTIAAILAIVRTGSLRRRPRRDTTCTPEHAAMGGPAHEEVVDGVKATFTVQTMADAMKAMGMEMPKGVKETHHISLALKDVKSGKALTEGEVTIKVQGPDKKEQTRELMGMHGHFGADFEMAKKGQIRRDVQVQDRRRQGPSGEVLVHREVAAIQEGAHHRAPSPANRFLPSYRLPVSFFQPLPANSTNPLIVRV